MEFQIYQAFLIFSFVFGVVVYVTLLFVSAPYGRHIRRGWGLAVNDRVAWILMEFPSPIVFFVLLNFAEVNITVTAIFFLIMWQAHYIHRAFIYPLRIINGHRKVPLLILGFGFIFNLGNAYVNGRYIFSFSGGYPNAWLKSPQFILGFLIFVAGFYINRWSDEMLRALRQPGEDEYKIPYGGLYKYISCPNYFGEIIEWIGWAIATWSIPGLAFAFWTFVHLAPRAKTHHKWYQDSFSDYPPERKALIPGIW